MSFFESPFDPFTTDTPEEEDILVEIDECKCSECGGTFELPADIDIDECPLCNIKFDSQGG
jgi:hypothetical protein